MRTIPTADDRLALLKLAANSLEADTILSGDLCPCCESPFAAAGVGSLMYLPLGSKAAVLHLCRACTIRVVNGEQDRVEAEVLLAASIARLEALDSCVQGVEA